MILDEGVLVATLCVRSLIDITTRVAVTAISASVEFVNLSAAAPAWFNYITRVRTRPPSATQRHLESVPDTKTPRGRRFVATHRLYRKHIHHVVISGNSLLRT